MNNPQRRPLPRFSRSLTLAATAAITAAATLAVACADPVGDAPRAQVQQGTAPQAVARDPAAPTARYVFSQDGSEVGFVGAKVTGKHIGSFKSFTGTIEAPSARVEDARVEVDIDMASVVTDNAKLTGHLQSPDFFDVARFPKARFVSTSIAKNADGTATVTGDLTLHGVSKRISFPARIGVAGETATAKAEFGINRKDFGVVYPGMPDDLIKDEVLLKLDVTARRAAASRS